MWMLLTLAHAGTLTDDLSTDRGLWSGGEVSDGVLVVDDTSATLELGGLASLSGTLTLRMVDDGAVQVGLGDASWTGTWFPGGGISLGEQTLPFPHGQRMWVPDASPVIEPVEGTWDAGNTLHCDIVKDGETWFLYWTGELSPGYAYRQIGVATSSDGVSWEPYAGNPVLTIDYSSDIDGVHVHMPTVVIDPTDGGWHMYYACYQNDVGNRICHATSDDGLAWTPRGMALDMGAEGEFDSGGLRMPDVQIDTAGTWHMLYNGTEPSEHYGLTGYATSPDGWTWTKQGAITDNNVDLQGGGMVQTAYGIEQWYNCDDVFCYAVADPDDWTDWALDTTPVLEKGWADWSSGYIQAPSPWLVDTTYHMWFNAYDYGVDDEVIAHARTEPAPGAWFTLDLDWDGSTLSASMDDGPVLSTSLGEADALRVTGIGQVEVDAVSLSWEPLPADTGGTDDSGGAQDTGSAQDTGGADECPTEVEPAQAGRCGCSVGARAGLAFLPALLAVARRRL